MCLLAKIDTKVEDFQIFSSYYTLYKNLKKGVDVTPLDANLQITLSILISDKCLSDINDFQRIANDLATFVHRTRKRRLRIGS